MALTDVTEFEGTGRFWSGSVDIRQGDQVLAAINGNWDRFDYGGATYRIEFEGWIGRTLRLKRGEDVLASARSDKLTASGFEVSCAGRSLRFAKEHALSNTYVLEEGEHRIGSVAPRSFFGRSFTASLPARFTTEQNLFLLWIFLSIRERQSGD